MSLKLKPILSTALLIFAGLVVFFVFSSKTTYAQENNCSYSYSIRDSEVVVDGQYEQKLHIEVSSDSGSQYCAASDLVTFQYDATTNEGRHVFLKAAGRGGGQIYVDNDNLSSGIFDAGPSDGDEININGISNTLVAETWLSDNSETNEDYNVDDIDVVKSSEAEIDEPECTSNNAFGWLLCGVINIAMEFVEWLQNTVIIPFLEISPLEAQEGDPVFEVWKSIRLLANVLLAPVFLFLIFAQVAGINLDAYTVKKTLPRLLIAAIGIQLSFYLVMIMVDITAVLGNGIGDLVRYPVNEALSSGQSAIELQSIGAQALGGLGLFAGILGALGVVSGALTTALFAAFLGLVPAMIMVFLTLVFRQVLVILLAILAPVAIAAWVLPNTQGIFEKWWGIIFKVLMMFPLIVLIFAAADLVALVASRIGGSGASGITDGAQATIGEVIAISSYIVPFALIPFTFRFAGFAISGVANAIQSVGGRVVNGREGEAGFLDNMREDAKRRKMESKAGMLYGGDSASSSFGNKLARFATNPRAVTHGLRNTRFGQRSRGVALAGFQSAMKGAGKEIDDIDISNPQVLSDFVQNGHNARALTDKVNDLKAEGKTSRAQELEKFSEWAGSAQHQSAALFRLSDMGLAKPQDFGAISDTVLAESEGAKSHVLSTAEFNMKKKGHEHLRPGLVKSWSGGVPKFKDKPKTDDDGNVVGPPPLRQMLDTLGVKGMSQARSDAIRVFGGQRYYENDEGQIVIDHNAPRSGPNFLQEYAQDTGNKKELAYAYSQMNADSRKALEDSLEPETLDEIRNMQIPGTGTGG